MTEEFYEDDYSDAIEYIELRLVDINGHLRGMTVPLTNAVFDLEEIMDDERIKRGINVDGSSLPGFADVENSDLHLQPDFSTLIELPTGAYRKAAVLCNLFHRSPTGEVSEEFLGDSRNLLKYTIQQLLRTKKMKIKPEPEFYLYNVGENGEIYPQDNGSYIAISPSNGGDDMMVDFANALEEIGMGIHYFHHEVGPAQQEIEISFTEVLQNVDNLATLKPTLKSLAKEHGVGLTFMPKPFAGEAGSGLHIHMRLFDGETNVFAGEESGTLSEFAQHFVAGILSHAAAITAVANPSINSYKRLIPGYEAPVYVSWGYRNRSTLVRVPMFNDASTAAVEFRSGDFTTNPYLLLTVLITAGMDGVAKQLTPPSPHTDNIFDFSQEELLAQNITSLPSNLGEALTALANDSIIFSALGPHIGSAFLKLKLDEWQEYTNFIVSDYELDKYLDI